MHVKFSARRIEQKKKNKHKASSLSLRDRVKLEAIERKINGVLQLSSRDENERVLREIRARPLSNPAARARSIFLFGGECDDSRRIGGRRRGRGRGGEGGDPDSFFIVRSSPTLFYRPGRDVRDESAHSPRCTRMTWPLFGSCVGARKRFQILTESRHARLITRALVRPSCPRR